MKLVIALGNKNDIGGPTQYAKELARVFLERGHHVSFVTYGTLLWSMPSGVRHLLYALKLFPSTIGANAVFAFDTLTVGAPAALACFLSRAPLRIRIGGDFLWEQYVERSGDLVKLSHFYQSSRQRWTVKERLIFRITSLVCRRSDKLFFNSDFLRTIWQSVYAFDTSKAMVVENVYPPRKPGLAPTATLFVSAGRPLKLKNEALLRKVISDLKIKYPALELDTRPLPPAEHQERISRCYAVIVASISDVSPNTIIDAVTHGKPFICTSDTGITERLAGVGVFVDTQNEQELRDAIELLLNEDKYREISERVRRFEFTRGWDEVAREFLHSAQDSLQKPGGVVGDGGLSVAVVGTEVAWFSDSAVRKRLLSYTDTLDAMHAVILTTRSQGFVPLRLKENVFVYPTNSASRLLAPFDAARILRRIAPLSVISAQDPFDSGLAVWLSGKKVPVEMQLHTDVFDKHFRSSFLNLIKIFLARFLLPKATTIRAVSERIKNTLPPALQKKTTVLPIFSELVRNEAAEERLRARFSQFSYRVLMVGRLEPEKQLARAIDIFANATKTSQNACLIIVGSGSQEKSLRAQIERLNLSKRVFIEPWQNPDPYYHVADLLLHTAAYEGYGLVLVEARRAGLPVLSTDVGVAREVGARVETIDTMKDALLDEIQKGGRRDEPFVPAFDTMQAYSDAIRAGWRKTANPT